MLRGITSTSAALIDRISLATPLVPIWRHPRDGKGIEFAEVTQAKPDKRR
jgi:hypothetical protein